MHEKEDGVLDMSDEYGNMASSQIFQNYLRRSSLSPYHSTGGRGVEEFHQAQLQPEPPDSLTLEALMLNVETFLFILALILTSSEARLEQI